MKKLKLEWKLYILECGDGTLYTGITNDLQARIGAHSSGKGAKYTRGRGPLKVVYTESFASRSAASVREAEVKLLDKAAKLKMINNQA